MEVKEFYESIGGDYEDVLSRLMKDERIEKFVKRFPADDSFAMLEKGLVEGDCDKAFSAAHTLKGVTANLSLKELNIRAEEITELLRGGRDFEGAKACFEGLKNEYSKVTKGIEKLNGAEN